MAGLELISRTNLSAGDRLNEAVHVFLGACIEVSLCLLSPSTMSALAKESFSLHSDSRSLNKEE